MLLMKQSVSLVSADFVTTLVMTAGTPDEVPAFASRRIGARNRNGAERKKAHSQNNRLECVIHAVYSHHSLRDRYRSSKICVAVQLIFCFDFARA